MGSRRGSVTDLFKSRRASRLTILVFAATVLSFYSWRATLLCRIAPFTDANDSEGEVDRLGFIDLQPAGLDNCQAVKDFADGLPEVKVFNVADLSAREELFPWTDDWISHGILPDSLQLSTPRFDLVYTWTNGSTADFQAEKTPLDEDYAARHREKLPNWQTQQGARHRSWDELRYSIRSAMRFGPSWLSRILIVSKRLAHQDSGNNYIQQPDWLDAHVSEAEIPVKVVADADIMTHRQCAPTYNSVSVESQLSHLNTTPYFVALSDDMFFGAPVVAPDFQSDLHGMTLNNYAEILHFDQAQAPVIDESIGGELLVAQFTSYMLNKRFGRRQRHIQQHHQKVISKSIMNEAMRTFPKAAILTPLSRHRYDSHQLYGWFLHNQFTIEMHREAMIWSVLWRMDKDGDGFLDIGEAHDFLAEIDAGKQAQLRSQKFENKAWAMRSIDDNLQKAGLPRLTAQRAQWSSMDGPVHLLKVDEGLCSASYTHMSCLGFDMNIVDGIPLDHLMEYLRNVTVTCGDCMLRYLLDNAEHGLDVILPRKSGSDGSAEYRQLALRALKKYAYTTAQPDSSFHMVHNAGEARTLHTVRIAAFTCINDDLVSNSDDELEEAFNGYATFFQNLFPSKLKIEKLPPRLIAPASGDPHIVEILDSGDASSPAKERYEAAIGKKGNKATDAAVEKMEVTQDSNIAGVSNSHLK